MAMKTQEKQTPPKLKRDQFVYRLDPERAQKVRDWAKDHYTKVQLMIERGLKLVMNEEKAVIDGQKRLSGKYPEKAKEISSTETDQAYNLRIPEYREWVDFVVDIFNSASQEDIDGLIANIQAFQRGIKYDWLLTIMQALKKDGTFPDATLTSAIDEASNFTRALTRARDAVKQLEGHEKGTRSIRPKRTG